MGRIKGNLDGKTIGNIREGVTNIPTRKRNKPAAVLPAYRKTDEQIRQMGKGEKISRHARLSHFLGSDAQKSSLQDSVNGFAPEKFRNMQQFASEVYDQITDYMGKRPVVSEGLYNEDADNLPAGDTEKSAMSRGTGYTLGFDDGEIFEDALATAKYVEQTILFDKLVLTYYDAVGDENVAAKLFVSHENTNRGIVETKLNGVLIGEGLISYNEYRSSQT